MFQKHRSLIQKLRFCKRKLCLQDNRTIRTTPLGRIASFYYLSHETIQLFHDKLNASISMEELLDLMTQVGNFLFFYFDFFFCSFAFLVNIGRENVVWIRTFSVFFLYYYGFSEYKVA